jgi:hypothetical protein
MVSRWIPSFLCTPAAKAYVCSLINGTRERAAQEGAQRTQMFEMISDQEIGLWAAADLDEFARLRLPRASGHVFWQGY